MRDYIILAAVFAAGYAFGKFAVGSWIYAKIRKSGILDKVFNYQPEGHKNARS